MISGVRIMFNPHHPPGNRLISVTVGEEHAPLEDDKEYTLAVKPYLTEGGDDYEMLKDCKCLVNEEDARLLSNMVRDHFTKWEVLGMFRKVRVRQLVQSAFCQKKLITRSSPTPQGHTPVFADLDGRITIITSDDEEMRERQYKLLAKHQLIDHIVALEKENALLKKSL